MYFAVSLVFLTLIGGGTSAAVARGDNITSSCYTVNYQNHCFYMNGSLLTYGDARNFCATLNSTLPIITDENIDNVFQQFIVNDANTLIQDSYVWIDAHARSVGSNSPVRWIDGIESGLFIFWPTVLSVVPLAHCVVCLSSICL